MNLGQAIVSDILQTGDIEPYLNSGLDHRWLKDPDQGAESVFGDERGNWYKAYAYLLKHHAQYGKVPSPALFADGFGAIDIIDQDDAADELVELAQDRVKRAVADFMLDQVEDAHRAGDLTRVENALSDGLEIIRNGLRSSERDSWAPVDAGAWLDGDRTPLKAELGGRDDGVHLLYPGKTHSLVGESEAGKSWLALYWVAQELEAGHDVGYIDFEDSADGIFGRLVELAGSAAIRKHFKYIRPESTLRDASGLAEHLSACSLVIVDGITEAMEMVPYDGNSNDWNGRYAKFQSLLLNPVAARGPAVLSIDHPVKSDTTSRHASGAGHKLRGLSGASYILVNREPFGRGRKGRSTVLVAKDRHGYVRTHGGGTDKASGMIQLAELLIDNQNAEFAPEIRLRPVDEFTDWKPTALMERVSDHLSRQGGPVSKNELEQARLGKAAYVRQAVNHLADLGFISVSEGGKGKATLISQVKLYQAGDDDE